MKDIGEKRRPGVAGTLVLVPSDELPLSSLPFGPYALVDVPFLSVGCDLQKDFWGPKMGPERFFYGWKRNFGANPRTADFGRLAAIPFRDLGGSQPARSIRGLACK